MQFFKTFTILFLICLTIVGCTSDSGQQASSPNSGSENNSNSSSGGSGGDSTNDPNSNTDRFHPLSFAEPGNHGASLMKGEMDCRACHGADLAGNIGPSCDNCHSESGGVGTEWRSTCTFCHGGSLDGSGAPPRYLNGLDVAESSAVFPAHQAHVHSAFTVNISCVQCH